MFSFFLVFLWGGEGTKSISAALQQIIVHGYPNSQSVITVSDLFLACNWQLLYWKAARRPKWLCPVDTNNN